MLEDLKQPSQRGLSAGKYGRDPAVSLWPRKGELERASYPGEVDTRRAYLLGRRRN